MRGSILAVSGRSRKGAWIEIICPRQGTKGVNRRSRKGAWIEIPTLERLWPYGYSRSRKGAWIEMSKELRPFFSIAVAPVRERGLKLMTAYLGILLLVVAPVRERGLKFGILPEFVGCSLKSLP